MSNSSNQLAVIGEAQHNGISFFNVEQFQHAQRVAQMFAGSALVPQSYQGNVANCVIALDLAARTGSSPMMVMQNLHPIHGKPSWSSQYIIASVNSSGRFTTLQYKIEDLGPLELKGVRLASNKQVTAYAWDRSIPLANRTKENALYGAPVSCAMAISEGWWLKAGSKWPTMTDLMLNYRAATFFGRMYAPDILMGMATQEESHDIVEIEPATDTVTKRLEEGTAKPRKRIDKGVSAAEVIVAAAATEVTTTVVQEPATEPASTTTAEPVSVPEAGTSAATIRTEVKTAKEITTPDGKIVTKVELVGDAAGSFTGTAFFEGLLKDFAANGEIIDFVLEVRPHKTDLTKTVNVISSYEVVAS